jgi:hypothetical protein
MPRPRKRGCPEQLFLRRSSVPDPGGSPPHDHRSGDRGLVVEAFRLFSIAPTSSNACPEGLEPDCQATMVPQPLCFTHPSITRRCPIGTAIASPRGAETVKAQAMYPPSLQFSPPATTPIDGRLRAALLPAQFPTRRAVRAIPNSGGGAQCARYLSKLQPRSRPGPRRRSRRWRGWQRTGRNRRCCGRSGATNERTSGRARNS